MDGTAQKKSRCQRQTTGGGNFFGAVTIEEMANHRRENCVNCKNHRENAGSGTSTPVKSVEQGNVKDAKRRVKAAGKAQNDKRKRGDKPRFWEQTHDRY